MLDVLLWIGWGLLIIPGLPLAFVLNFLYDKLGGYRKMPATEGGLAGFFYLAAFISLFVYLFVGLWLVSRYTNLLA